MIFFSAKFCCNSVKVSKRNWVLNFSVFLKPYWVVSKCLGSRQYIPITFHFLYTHCTTNDYQSCKSFLNHTNPFISFDFRFSRFWIFGEFLSEISVQNIRISEHPNIRTSKCLDINSYFFCIYHCNTLLLPSFSPIFAP